MNESRASVLYACYVYHVYYVYYVYHVYSPKMEKSHSKRHELIFCLVINCYGTQRKANDIIGTNKLVYHIKMVNRFKKVLWESLAIGVWGGNGAYDLYPPGKFKGFTTR